MGIGVHLVDLFLIVLLKQKVKLEFLVRVNAYYNIFFFCVIVYKFLILQLYDVF
jgi:hypothetical protein